MWVSWKVVPQMVIWLLLVALVLVGLAVAVLLLSAGLLD
jgi:hypothetical protein